MSNSENTPTNLSENKIKKSIYNNLSAIAVSVIAIGVFSFVYLERREMLESIEKNKSEVAERVTVAKRNANVAVPRLFTTWSETVVAGDGSIEKWSGQESEFLFFATSDYCEAESSVTIPCWEVYAKTKSSNRYFIVTIDVNPKINNRYEIKKRLKEVQLQEVINAAIHSGRSDVVKRLGVIEKPA